MPHRLLALIAGLIIGLAGCDLLGMPTPQPPMRACTEIGCESAVAFHLDVDLETGVAYELEACVDADCAEETIVVPAAAGFGHRTERFDVSTQDDRVLFLLPDGDFPGRHRVSLRVTGSDGLVSEVEALVEFERNQPNGPGCPPVCWFAEVFA